MGKQNKFLIMATSVFAALLGCSIFLCFGEGTPLHFVEIWLQDRIGTDLFSYYTAQLSLTFITISVMTVLSEKSVIIYWENIAESRLIKPTFGCFAAFCWYSIIANIGAAIGVFLQSSTVFTVFFMANIVVLILLTNAIVDVYYGKDVKKKKLIKQLKKDYQKHCKGSNCRIDAYTEKILGLQHRVRQLHTDSDLLALNELYLLYQNEFALFNDPAAESFTEALSGSLDMKTSGLFLEMLTSVTATEEARAQKYVSDSKKLFCYTETALSRKEIAQQLRAAESIATTENRYQELLSQCWCNQLLLGNQIWISLVHTEALKKWVARVDTVNTWNQDYFDFARLIKRRLVSVYNCCVCYACMRKEHPEFIDSMLVTYRSDGGVYWNSDGADTNEAEMLSFIELSFAHMKKSVCFEDPLYVMWSVVRDFYAASHQNPNVTTGSGEYRDFPIPDFMLHWAYYDEECKLLYTLLGKETNA